jgi:hypothetical protein
MSGEILQCDTAHSNRLGYQSVAVGCGFRRVEACLRVSAFLIRRIGEAITLIRDRDRRDIPHAQQRRETVVDPLEPFDTVWRQRHFPRCNGPSLWHVERQVIGIYPLCI